MEQTKQMTFDTVVNALREQGIPSVSGSYSCAYRGHNGAKCAAGHLIPNELYKESFEGISVLPGNDHLLEKSLEGHNLYLVKQLQIAHDTPVVEWAESFDDTRWLADFEELARKVAKGNKLKYTPVEESDDAA